MIASERELRQAVLAYVQQHHDFPRVHIESVECTHCEIVGRIPHCRVHVILQQTAEWLEEIIRNADPADAKEIARWGAAGANFDLAVFTRGTDVVCEKWMYVDF